MVSALEILCAIALFLGLYALFFCPSRNSGRFRMDPIQADAAVREVQGGFEPHLRRYQALAQLLLTLATATVAFLVNFLVGIHVDEKRGIYSLRLEGACRSTIVFRDYSLDKG